MKRFALLLAATISAAGCVIETTPTGSATIDWSFYGLVSASGATGLACDAGTFQTLSGDVYGVDLIDVYVDTDPVPYTAYCTDGYLTITGLDEGLHDIVVEGFDSSGTFLMVRDWATVDVIADTDTTFDFTPGEAYLGVDYLLDSVPFDTCLSVSAPYSGTDWISFDVYDAIDKVTVSYNQYAACNDTTYAAITRIPWGIYSVSWVGEEQWNTSAPAGYDVLRETTVGTTQQTLWDEGGVTTWFSVALY